MPCSWVGYSGHPFVREIFTRSIGHSQPCLGGAGRLPWKRVLTLVGSICVLLVLLCPSPPHSALWVSSAGSYLTLSSEHRLSCLDLTQCLTAFQLRYMIVQPKWASDVNRFGHCLVPNFSAASLATSSAFSFPATHMCPEIRWNSTATPCSTSSVDRSMILLASHCPGPRSLWYSCFIATCESAHIWTLVHGGPVTLPHRVIPRASPIA